MEASLKLHLLAGSSRSAVVMVTAIASKLEFNTEFHKAGDGAHETLRKVNPYGKFPSMEGAEGSLFESTAICRYLARKSNSMYGANVFEQSQVDQWIDLLRTGEFKSEFSYAIYGFPENKYKYDIKNFDADFHLSLKSLQVIDQKLNGKDFLVGDSLTIADITLVCDVASLYRYFMKEKERKQLAHLTAYFEKMIKRPEFKAVFGVIEYPTQQFARLTTKVEKPKKEEKPKEQPKKKEEEPADDGVIEIKAKVYNFPETKFDFFNFKTMFVNATNKQEALDFLWANWDANAFSFWYLKYDKLPSEGKKLFLTNNLMNGFLDRAELCRKHSLGVHGVYGDVPDLEVRGVWMWKGTELLEPLKEHVQFDVYHYTKLDITKAEDKDIITQYWTKMNEEEDKVEGRTVQTLKLFK